jgi:hypothetical protein
MDPDEEMLDREMPNEYPVSQSAGGKRKMKKSKKMKKGKKSKKSKKNKQSKKNKSRR